MRYYLKIAGWNIFQAARAKKMRQHVAEQMEKQAPKDQNAQVPHAMDRHRLFRHSRLFGYRGGFLRSQASARRG